MTVFSGQTWNTVVELANMQSPGPLPAYKKEKERKKKRRKERKKEKKKERKRERERKDNMRKMGEFADE